MNSSCSFSEISTLTSSPVLPTSFSAEGLVSSRELGILERLGEHERRGEHERLGENERRGEHERLGEHEPLGEHERLGENKLLGEHERLGEHKRFQPIPFLDWEGGADRVVIVNTT